MRTFTRKGFGRIYVADSKDIDAVKTIITSMDDFEATYLPIDMIVHISNYPAVVYTGKFDELNLDDLTILCFKKGIHIMAFDAGRNEYPYDALEKYKVEH
jgi:hypothetical protein